MGNVMNARWTHPICQALVLTIFVCSLGCKGGCKGSTGSRGVKSVREGGVHNEPIKIPDIAGKRPLYQHEINRTFAEVGSEQYWHELSDIITKTNPKVLGGVFLTYDWFDDSKLRSKIIHRIKEENPILYSNLTTSTAITLALQGVGIKYDFKVNAVIIKAKEKLSPKMEKIIRGVLLELMNTEGFEDLFFLERYKKNSSNINKST